MNKTYIAQRLKKYLFLISIIFIVLTTSHLIYSYIYSDAKETAIKGGTISEGLIGQIPSLNPLKNFSSNDQYINSIVYRSLLKYDNDKKSIVSDLAKCDTRNLLKIECFLETNIKWSNGENINKDDIVATFKTLKSSNVNRLMSSLLKSVTIEKTKTSIIFYSTKKDINILKIFFQPIVSKKILNIISKKEINGEFSLSSGLYSGKYKVANLFKEQTSGITTLRLEKNNYYFKNNVYIDNIVFKIFPDIPTFLKNKNSINIFNDNNNLVGGTIPKLKKHTYTLPQYVSLFINTHKVIDNDFRELILKQIDRKEVLKRLGTDNYKGVQDPYLSNIYIKENILNKNIISILNKKGYFNISELKEKFNDDLKEVKNNFQDITVNQVNNISEEAKIKEKIISKNEDNKPIGKKVVNEKSKIIFSPNWVDKYNFISKDSYLLKGKAKKDTTKIYINNYELKDFSPNQENFYYRISEKNGNLKVGHNNYSIYFVINGKKILQEEINFYKNSNKEELKKAKQDFFEKKGENNIEKTENPKLKNIIPENKKFISSEKYIQIEKKIEKLKKLDEKYFYNTNLEIYNLELYYISNKTDIKKTSEYIAEKLGENGIKVSLRGISTKDLSGLISEGKKNYDLLLTGVNLSYFNFNIYPYFHSTQIEKGYNFSNFRKLDLDIVLEELKSKLLNDEKRTLLNKKALYIIQNNNLQKTLYTPILSNLVDKNIKGYSLNDKIVENYYRFDPIYKSYINQDKKIIFDNKSFLGYINFLFKTLF